MDISDHETRVILDVIHHACHCVTDSICTVMSCHPNVLHLGYILCTYLSPSETSYLKHNNFNAVRSYRLFKIVNIAFK